MRRLDFRDHRRDLHGNQYVYAVVSRRVGGLSIGVNLNPDKACNFDCPYCQVDRTVPGGPSVIDLDRLDAELDALLSWVADGSLWDIAPFSTADPALRRVGDISIAGDGEPTACRSLADAICRIGVVRARHALDHVPLSLLSNATLFHRPAVQRGLAQLDALDGVIWAKLDAGTEAYFQRVDGTTIKLQRILDNLTSAAIVRPIVLQCMFHTFDDVGPDDAEIDAWVARLAEICAAGGTIRVVQVYTVARSPADLSVGALSTQRLHEIADRARALGVEVSVHGGVATP